MNYDDFLSHHKSLIVAPAGYGKTYTLSECIKHSPGKSLILTHTHACVSSIKAKLKSQLIDSSKYKVETISSFSQKYTNAFYVNDDIPEQDSGDDYHQFMIMQAKILCATELIQGVIKNTYTGFFVDEYQDCTKDQHELMMEISNILPFRVFGDPLQGIFDFNNQELVDFENDLADFYEAPSLTVPYRWNNTGHNELGQALQDIRELLVLGQPINLNDYSPQIEVIIASERDFFNPRSDYCRAINQVRNDESLLVINPNSARKDQRINFSKRFKGINSIESLDDRDFYLIAKSCDNVDLLNKVSSIKTIAYKIFDKSGLDVWFNNTGLKNKQDAAMKRLSDGLKRDILDANSIYNIGNVLNTINDMPEVNCTRREVYKAIMSALNIASSDNSSIYEAMKKHKNNVRRQGRALYGRHIGTTLLTKGLEFGTVLVLDAHLFDCPKNLYVAITRCCSRLIIVSATSILSPYK